MTNLMQLNVVWRLETHPESTFYTVMSEYDPDLVRALKAGDYAPLIQACIAEEYSDDDPVDWPLVENGYELILVFLGTVKVLY